MAGQGEGTQGRRGVNHRDLLKKYINHVGECEGITFLSEGRRTAGLTDEEWEALQLLDIEADADLDTK